MPIPARSVIELCHLSQSCCPVLWKRLVAFKRERLITALLYFPVSPPVFPDCVLRTVGPGELSLCETSAVWGLKPVAAVPGTSEFCFCQKHLYSTFHCSWVIEATH